MTNIMTNIVINVMTALKKVHSHSGQLSFFKSNYKRAPFFLVSVLRLKL